MGDDMQAQICMHIMWAATLLSTHIARLQNEAPIAHAGLLSYAAQEPVQLDGTGSYDPDESGPLTHRWTQTSGPTVVMIGANTPTPTLSEFAQTDVAQECEFELTVSDGEQTSLPTSVRLVIVPHFGLNTLYHGNPPFDSNKPTLVFFGGGNCVSGGGFWESAGWAERANIISFITYSPDPSLTGERTYYRYGDMLISFLSSVAPHYAQPIQVVGWSTGGQPAIDVGVHLNLIYQDPRYAINRLTFLDATPFCRGDYRDDVRVFLASSVAGEQCWIDNYVSTISGPGPWRFFFNDVLNVGTEIYSHTLAPAWYDASLLGEDMSLFNQGIVAGAYWSVVGPGKNLQLAVESDAQIYEFKWHGSESSGHMAFFDEPNHPGRLPEPVTLVGPLDIGDPNGLLFTCQESENAVGYELLFGADPYRVMDYHIISDTPTPPHEVVSVRAFAETWWTVRVRDAFGSTIYADPVLIDPGSVPPVTENGSAQ